MKKLITGYIFFMMAMITLMPLAKAQKKAPFTGTIVYNITVQGNVSDEAKMMLPSEMIMKISPDKLSQVMHSDMMDIKTIFDASTKVSNTMMDMMGQKMSIKKTAVQLTDEQKKKGTTMTIKPSGEVKIIAGHKCRRAIVSMKSNKSTVQTFDTYYTEDIDISKYNFGNTFPNVNGLPLEFSMSQGPFSLKLTAKSIKKENIAASEFAIPSDYKQVKPDKMKSLFNGGGQ